MKNVFMPHGIASYDCFGWIICAWFVLLLLLQLRRVIRTHILVQYVNQRHIYRICVRLNRSNFQVRVYAQLFDEAAAVGGNGKQYV